MSLARTSETSEAAKSTSTSASSQIFTSVTSLRESVRFNTCSELAVMRKQGWLGS
eukprot:m.202477 g.202477  ORF g.202477 m.202477 type:complete len:55 (+) comp53838_c0_seq7:59-223(+)